jgi:uncharacterized protein (TIGR03435 family)
VSAIALSFSLYGFVASGCHGAKVDGEMRSEVASVKPNKTTERMDYRLRGGRSLRKNIPAKGWIQIAWGVRDFQIVALEWLSNEKFDIEARAEKPGSAQQTLLMLQKLLTARFKLILHPQWPQDESFQDQTLRADDFPAGLPNGQPLSGASPAELAPGTFAGEAIPMSMFVNLLSSPLDRVVIDKTV